MSIYKNLIAFQNECPQPNLDGEVKYGNTKFQYATLGNIINTIKPILYKNKLGFYQAVEDNKVVTVIFSSDCDTQIKSSIALPLFNKAQDLGAYLTYVKRYELAALLGIVADEDNDGQVLTPKESQKDKDSRVERETLIKFLKKCDSVAKLQKLEDNMVEKGKLTKEYENMIGLAKQAIIDKKLAE